MSEIERLLRRIQRNWFISGFTWGLTWGMLFAWFLVMVFK